MNTKYLTLNGIFQEHQPKELQKKLNLSVYQVRIIAKRHGVRKCPAYIKLQRKQLIEHRRKWYESAIKSFEPNVEQEQLIFGSLLGDGYISRGANRSINFYYREHFSEQQREYRVWKLEILKGLPFSIRGNFLNSSSHPYFTNLHRLLYKNNVRTISKDFLITCFHPLFLTALYLDDGSLTISYTYNEKNNIVYCHPSIILYTLNFSKFENEMLAKHLNKTFGTFFVVSGHPDGNGYLLKINKEKDVVAFLNIIKPFAKKYLQ